MVRFTLRDTKRSSSMRVEMEPDDGLAEVSTIAREYWGSDRFVIRNGYRLLDDHGAVGDQVKDGDMVDLIPDLRMIRF